MIRNYLETSSLLSASVREESFLFGEAKACGMAKAYSMASLMLTFRSFSLHSLKTTYTIYFFG